MIKQSQINYLEDLALQARRKIVAYSHKTKLPHLGSCLSLVEILIALYFDVASLNEQQPNERTRDRIVLSKGHGAPALFQILAMKGFFSEALLHQDNHGGGLFGEHPPAPKYLAGIEAATGSLGHGLPMAIGMALSAKISKTDFHTFAICGDGECNEGTIWESLLFASSKNLENISIIIDYNKWQATGRSTEVMALEPLDRKFESFGFETLIVDGHDLKALCSAFTMAKRSKLPTAVIAHTVKGKGVSFMEDDNNWHYRTPNERELHDALKELSN